MTKPTWIVRLWINMPGKWHDHIEERSVCAESAESAVARAADMRRIGDVDGCESVRFRP